MATTRAKRLERYLSQKLGWETGSGTYECKRKGCGFFSYSEQNYCSKCGAKMPDARSKPRDEELFEGLESAMKYALGRSKEDFGE